MRIGIIENDSDPSTPFPKARWPDHCLVGPSVCKGSVVIGRAARADSHPIPQLLATANAQDRKVGIRIDLRDRPISPRA